jgi:hypothetical protein
LLTKIKVDLSEFPPVSDELLAACRRAFPDACPGLDVSEAERFARFGAQRFIAFLAAKNRLQFHSEEES